MLPKTLLSMDEKMLPMDFKYLGYPSLWAHASLSPKVSVKTVAITFYNNSIMTSNLFKGGRHS